MLSPAVCGIANSGPDADASLAVLRSRAVRVLDLAQQQEQQQCQGQRQEQAPSPVSTAHLLELWYAADATNTAASTLRNVVVSLAREAQNMVAQGSAPSALYSRIISPAVVFDIDDTLLFEATDPRAAECQAAMKRLYYFVLRDLGAQVFLVTARRTRLTLSSDSRSAEHVATVQQLREAGYEGWSALYLLPMASRWNRSELGIAEYKEEVRKFIARSHVLILSAGDRWTDLLGPGCLRSVCTGRAPPLVVTVPRPSVGSRAAKVSWSCPRPASFLSEIAPQLIGSRAPECRAELTPEERALDPNCYYFGFLPDVAWWCLKLPQRPR